MRFCLRYIAVLTVAATVDLTGPVYAGSKSVITHPDWQQKPTGEQMSEHYPIQAEKMGISGRAIIRCEVTGQGQLERCKVLKEHPRGLGFGEAALALSEHFRMSPKTIDGRPVDGGVVTIPLTFEYPEERLGDGAMVMTRAGTIASESATGPLMSCPDGYGQCYAHYLTWRAQPDAKLTKKMLAKAAPTTGITFVVCTGGVDGSLQGCSFFGETSAPAMSIVKMTLEILRTPEKADDGLATAAATIVIPFMWEWIGKGAKKGT